MAPDPIVTLRDLDDFLAEWHAEASEVDASEPGRVRVAVRFRPDVDRHVESRDKAFENLRRDLRERSVLGVTWSITLAGHEGPYR